jgi:hypothetical protein
MLLLVDIHMKNLLVNLQKNTQELRVNFFIKFHKKIY